MQRNSGSVISHAQYLIDSNCKVVIQKMCMHLRKKKKKKTCFALKFSSCPGWNKQTNKRRGAHLMVRRSHPRMAVSLAVASWLQLWCGLHLPEVNFSWPLPSRVAVLVTWRGQRYQKIKKNKNKKHFWAGRQTVSLRSFHTIIIIIITIMTWLWLLLSLLLLLLTIIDLIPCSDIFIFRQV